MHANTLKNVEYISPKLAYYLSVKKRKKVANRNKIVLKI